MAITKIIKVKANPKACIKYVTNPNKTNDKLLVSCVGCTEQNAPGIFNLALMGNGQKALDEQVVKAYHFIQSFATNDEVTPEEAHQIGMDFMKRTFDDKYAFVCSTHVDKGHIHNHFVMCAAARDMSGRKLDDNLSLLHKIRNTNDAICKEHGLSVIDKEKGKSKSYKEWLADKQNPTGSNKIKLRKLIDYRLSCYMLTHRKCLDIHSSVFELCCQTILKTPVEIETFFSPSIHLWTTCPKVISL